jgi:Flp pilus assembly protein TadD
MHSFPTKTRRALAGLAAMMLVGACAFDQNGPTSAVTGDAFDRMEATPVARTLRLADAARAGGDLASAVRLYRQAIRQHPDRLRPYIDLGDTLHAQGTYHEAIDAFDAAAKRARADGDVSGEADALTGEGRALLGLRRPAEALEPLGAALDLVPDHRVARNARAVALDGLGRHREAQEVYRRLLEADGDNALAQGNLGLSLAISGDHEAAVGVLDDLVMRAGAGPRARQNLAVAYALAGDYDAAREVMRADLGERAVEDNIAYLDTVRFLLRARDPAVRKQGRRALGGGAE